MNILLIGAPGVGKGTISKYLIEKYGLKHISTGDILRKAVADETQLGLKVKDYMDSGTLVPDQIIIDLIKETLNQTETSKGFIFDGFPRTINQAKEFSVILDELNSKIDLALVLDVDDDVVIKRITGRRVCPKCNALYNIYYKAPLIENKCDECGETLFTRNDDNLDSLKKRLSEYHINAESLINYYDFFKVVKYLDASKSRDEEFLALDEILKEIK